MGFTQAITTCFAKYATFSGRASRSEYWFFCLFSLLAGTVAMVLDMMLLPSAVMVGISPLYFAFFLVSFLPGLSVLVRRFHDIGKSGWAWLIALIPFVGAIMLLIWLCRPGADANQYGPNPLASLGVGPAPVAA